MAEPTNHLLCFGFGFSAMALTRLLSSDNWRITGTSRTIKGCESIRKLGHEPVLFDGETVLGASALDGVTHVLHSIAPDAGGDPVYQFAGDALAEHAPNIRWFGYLSTTGVYGDQGGAWVNEQSEISPTTDRGRMRASAEAVWCDMYQDIGLPVHLFRLAGIYGPGRNQIEALKTGTAKRIIKQGQVFSRVHVDDIAGVLLASINQPNPGAAYNVCDDEPCPPQDVVAYAAELAGMAPPPEIAFEEADLSSMARSFYAESKRVSNQRVKDELGYVFKYPNYKTGLKSLL